MKIEERYRKMVQDLHQKYPVVDAHLDLAGEILLRVQKGERNPLKDCYLDHFRKAGIKLVVSSIYLRNDELPEGGLRKALDQISVLLEAVDQNPEFCLIRTKADLDALLQSDQIGILMQMEGLDCIGNDIRLLRILWELGVRGASLTWSRRNMLASGCCTAAQLRPIPGGLSEDGIKAVQEMERLGMYLDISHLNDEGFEDVFRITTRPFAATHSNSQAVHMNYRNLTDEQMQTLAARGGMMGLNGCTLIVGSANGEDALEKLCQHIEYETALIGVDKVGFGFDFCDSYDEAAPRQTFALHKYDALVDHSHVPELTAALLQRGMSEENVRKVMGGNWIAYFRKILPEN